LTADFTFWRSSGGIFPRREGWDAAVDMLR
jgi:hypothetical protein